MCQQHPQFLTAYRLHMHRTIKPRPHHLRYAARIVAVRLVDLRLQHRLHVPRLNADHRQPCFGESAEHSHELSRIWSDRRWQAGQRPAGALDTGVLARQVKNPHFRPLKEPGPWRNPSSVANASATVVARDFTISTRTRSFARNAIPSWSLPQ